MRRFIIGHGSCLREVTSDDRRSTSNYRFTCAGQEKTARIIVGRPRPTSGDPNGDWMCAIFIENFTDRIVPVMGVGPVDALKNAMLLVAEFEKKVGPVTPRAAQA